MVNDGDEIESDERNLKLDSTNDDVFHRYSDSYGSDVNDDRCCMEWDADIELFIAGTGAQYGREAKLECDGGKD